MAKYVSGGDPGVKLMHFANACAWGINALLWIFYAHNAFFGGASLITTGIAVVLMVKESRA